MQIVPKPDSQISNAKINIDDELIIAIWPRYCVRFFGTSAQLIDEGLIPDNLIWPERNHPASWENGTFEFSLNRVRPEGMKGRCSLWLTGNYWRLECRRKYAHHHSFRDQIIYEKQRELDNLKFADSPAGRRQGNLWAKARGDSMFQAFITSIPGARRKRPGRPTSSEQRGAGHGKKK